MEKNQDSNPNFSLLELLVVIAFVSLLFSFSANVLEDQRKGAADASVQEHLFLISRESRIFYLKNNDSYDGFCQDRVITDLLSKAVEIGQGDLENLDDYCFSSESEWAVISPLSSTDGFWCTDSQGVSGILAAEEVNENLTRCNNLSLDL